MGDLNDILDFLRIEGEKIENRMPYQTDEGNYAAGQQLELLNDIERFVKSLRNRHPPLVHSIARMARYSGVTQQFLKEAIDEGWIPCIHSGGSKYVFNRERVLEAILERAGRVGNERDG